MLSDKGYVALDKRIINGTDTTIKCNSVYLYSVLHCFGTSDHVNININTLMEDLDWTSVTLLKHLKILKNIEAIEEYTRYYSSLTVNLIKKTENYIRVTRKVIKRIFELTLEETQAMAEKHNKDLRGRDIKHILLRLYLYYIANMNSHHNIQIPIKQINSTIKCNTNDIILCNSILEDLGIIQRIEPVKHYTIPIKRYKIIEL